MHLGIKELKLFVMRYFLKNALKLLILLRFKSIFNLWI